MRKFAILFFSLGLLFFSFNVNAESLAERLSGRILLDVENHGAAWYVDPDTKNRHYLGTPEQAFSLMREKGLGITDTDLAKIPMYLEETPGLIDSDNDGLADDHEVFYATDPNKADTDDDGVNDKEEIDLGRHPNGPGSLYDTNLTERAKGKILLQVKSKGQAWYVDPVTGKRHYLGRPKDAFNVMRKLGLGITAKNIFKITKAQNQGFPTVESNPNQSAEEVRLATTCTNFDCMIKAVETCEEETAYLDVRKDIFDLKLRSTSYYEIKNRGDGGCGFFQKVSDQEVTFSSEMEERLRNEGISQKEIDEQEEVVDLVSGEAIGKSGTCWFKDKKDLTNLLAKLRDDTVKGVLSCRYDEEKGQICKMTVDWEKGECSGNLYESF